MPRSSKKPPWKLTDTPWEIEVLIWERMALGDNDIRVGMWLDQRVKEKSKDRLSLDRHTTGLIRKELSMLPETLAKTLPKIYDYWLGLQTQIVDSIGMILPIDGVFQEIKEPQPQLMPGTSETQTAEGILVW